MYHLPVQNPTNNPVQKPGRNPTQNALQNPAPETARIRAPGNTGIWLAWLAALVFHALVFWLPISCDKPVSENLSGLIELQLSRFEATPSMPDTEPEPVTEIEPDPEIEPEPVQNLAETPPEAAPEKTTPPVATAIDEPRLLRPELEDMNEQEKTQLTHALLLRQYISEESETERIFGRQIQPDQTEPRKEFHFPVRPNMLSMLNQPLPDIPFAYEPGLIYFAYDPGVKGGLQRFWDVITPEFGWRTRYGTEVKCVWVLVIAACGWK